MSPTVFPSPEGRGRYWTGQCSRPGGGCGSVALPDCRIRQQRYWNELPDLCLCHPHIARVENAITDHGDDRAWLSDREVAKALMDITPYTKTALRLRHAFTVRVVQHALEHGITQFLDLGAGHLHTSAAHAAVTRAETEQTPRIVLVDHDVLVNAHGQGDLDAGPLTRHRAALVRGNVFAVGRMLNQLAKRKLLDLDQRVCVLAVDILPYLEPELDARAVPRRLAQGLQPGSIVAITHLSDRPLLPPANADDLVALRAVTAHWYQAHQRCVPPHPRPRDPAEFARLFTDLDLLPPGITTTRRWPEPDDTRHPRAPYTLAAVGHVPERRAVADRTDLS